MPRELKYIGEGRTVPGIPAADITVLTDAEYQAAAAAAGADLAVGAYALPAFSVVADADALIESELYEAAGGAPAPAPADGEDE